MPTYRDSAGELYWFDQAPDPAEVRADLVQLTPEEESALVTTVPVPAAVTMRQARLALLGAGALSSVDPMIAALPSPQREAAQIEWEFASEVRRDSPLVAMLGQSLGMDSAAIDGLFIAAFNL